MFGYIYKITLPNGRCYVGCKKKATFDENYWGSSRNPEYWKDLEKYGKENCKREILEWIENEQDMAQQEDYWILHENAFIKQGGYNLAKSCHPFYQNEYTIQKIKDGNKKYNANLTEEQKLKRSQFCREKCLNPTGIYQSKEYKEKMSKSLKKVIKEKGGIWNKGLTKESNAGVKKISETKKNGHWYTNGVIETFCKNCPEGFYIGRKPYSVDGLNNIKRAAKNLQRRKKISLSKKGSKNPAFGKHWYTNGNINILTFDCPKGFKPGKLKTKAKFQQ